MKKIIFFILCIFLISGCIDIIEIKGTVKKIEHFPSTYAHSASTIIVLETDDIITLNSLKHFDVGRKIVCQGYRMGETDTVETCSYDEN
jgi:hypothetical protein